MSSIIEILTAAGLGTLGLKGIKMIIAEEKVRELRGTCFRGTHLAVAGNSSLWNTPTEMVRSTLFREAIGEVITESVRENWPLLLEGFEETVMLPFGLPDGVAVGWVTTLPRQHINGARLVLANIHPGLRGMLVTETDLDHPAPLTNLVSLKLGLKLDFKDRNQLAVRLLDMHFGEDHRELSGDYTGAVRMPGELDPRKIVFFPKNHPGGTQLVLLDP